MHTHIVYRCSSKVYKFVKNTLWRIYLYVFIFSQFRGSETQEMRGAAESIGKGSRVEPGADRYL